MEILQTIILSFFSSLVGGFVSYYFAQKTESQKLLQLHKQKAEAVAHLFAMWFKYKGKEKELLTNTELADYYENLNRMSLELSIWMKDEKLLTDVMRRLQNLPDSKDPRSIIGEIRRLILETPSDKFDPQQITLWPK